MTFARQVEPRAKRPLKLYLLITALHLAAIATGAAIGVRWLARQDPHARAAQSADDDARFEVEFEALGLPAAQLAIAADDQVTVTIDGEPVDLPFRQPAFETPTVVKVPQLRRGRHHMEIDVVNVNGAGKSWAENPAGVAFRLTETDGTKTWIMASSDHPVQVDGHEAVKIAPHPAWTRAVGAPWIWRSAPR
jgi:hypothetical protein